MIICVRIYVSDLLFHILFSTDGTCFSLYRPFIRFFLLHFALHSLTPSLSYSRILPGFGSYLFHFMVVISVHGSPLVVDIFNVLLAALLVGYTCLSHLYKFRLRSSLSPITKSDTTPKSDKRIWILNSTL
jgi:hypothetical protein